jgi:predicted RNA-binding Zn-ribbon protein involved in translation (DUF1610 family)
MGLRMTFPEHARALTVGILGPAQSNSVAEQPQGPIPKKRRKVYNAPMQKNKINRAKVLAALNTICPFCGVSISPAEIVRVDSERMRCPKCGHVFEAGKSPSAKR